MTKALLLTRGLLPACNVLASPFIKIYLLCGSAGKGLKFDGRQQAVNVVSHFMTARDFIFLSLLNFPAMGQGQAPKNEPGKVTVHHVNLEELVEDDVGPPPSHLASKFRTLEDWLLDISKNDNPRNSISKYKLGLFESKNDYTLYLVGTNTYQEGQNRSVTRIEFEPTNMYFKLPSHEYKNLDRDELIDKLTSQLKDFATTENFKNSFFTQATTIVFETSGQTIWSKD